MGAALHTLERVEEAAAHVRQSFSTSPEVAIILGTGLGGLASAIESPTIVPYDGIPYFPLSTVESHAGRLLCGTLSGKTIVAMQGRFHMYEGHDWDVVTLPARVLVEWGVKNLYLTNAAGGLNSSFKVGDLMLLNGYRDHRLRNE